MPRPRPPIATRLRSRDKSPHLLSISESTPSKEEPIVQHDINKITFSPRHNTAIYLEELQNSLSFVRGTGPEREQVLLEEAEKLACSFGKIRTRSSSFYKANIVPPVPSKRAIRRSSPIAPLKPLPPSFIISKRTKTITKKELKGSDSSSPSSTPSPVIPKSPRTSPSQPERGLSPPTKSQFPVPFKKPIPISEEEKKRLRRVKRMHELRRLQVDNKELILASDASRSDRGSSPAPSLVILKEKTRSQPNHLISQSTSRICVKKRKPGRPRKHIEIEPNFLSDESDVIAVSSDSSQSNNNSDFSRIKNFNMDDDRSGNRSNNEKGSYHKVKSDSDDEEKSDSDNIVIVSSDSEQSTASFGSDSEPEITHIPESDDSGSEFSDGPLDFLPKRRKRPSRAISLNNKSTEKENGPPEKKKKRGFRPVKRASSSPVRSLSPTGKISPESKRVKLMRKGSAKKVTFSSPVVADCVPNKEHTIAPPAVTKPSVIPLPLSFRIPKTDMDKKQKHEEYCRRQRRLFVHSRFIHDDEAALVALSVYSSQSTEPNDRLVHLLQKNFNKYRVKLKRIFDDLSRVISITKKEMTREDRILRLLISDQMTERILKSVWDYWIEEPYVDENEFYKCEASVSLLKEVTVQAVICHYKEKYGLISSKEFADEMERLDRITRALHLPECEEDKEEES